MRLDLRIGMQIDGREAICDIIMEGERRKHMKNLERTLKALANRRRLAIVAYLKKNREMKVGDIAEAITLSVKSTSRHLSVLAAADVLEREQRSLEVFYRVSSRQHSVVKHIISIL